MCSNQYALLLLFSSFVSPNERNRLWFVCHVVFITRLDLASTIHDCLESLIFFNSRRISQVYNYNKPTNSSTPFVTKFLFTNENSSESRENTNFHYNCEKRSENTWFYATEIDPQKAVLDYYICFIYICLWHGCFVGNASTASFAWSLDNHRSTATSITQQLYSNHISIINLT